MKDCDQLNTDDIVTVTSQNGKDHASGTLYKNAHGGFSIECFGVEIPVTRRVRSPIDGRTHQRMRPEIVIASVQSCLA